jgi:hypothetical protein
MKALERAVEGRVGVEAMVRRMKVVEKRKSMEPCNDDIQCNKVIKLTQQQSCCCRAIGRVRIVSLWDWCAHACA